MGRRNVYGNDWSENGWPMVDEASCTWTVVPGTGVNLQIQNGWPLAVMRAFAADFNAYVEPLRDADSACWTAGNSVSTSNHLSGSAMDLNWDSHPFQIADAGFNGGQIATIREMLGWYEDTIFWGDDWDSPKDAMHFQMGYSTYNNQHTQDFINRKIRADGFSTFRRVAGSPVLPVHPDAAGVLAEVMGNTNRVDYPGLVHTVAQALQASECDNVNRIAMWCAQIGHESGGLFYTEEIASGAAYEGRHDLGNDQPGDGVRYKGRSWIQITGRNNYTQLSKWAFGKGLVPQPAEFVDNPNELASDQYAGLGAAWYWVVARSDINELSDNQDLNTVTRRINGGLNGLADRQTRYNRALAMGDRLLALHSDDTEPTLEDYLMADTLYDSWSLYATPGEPAKFTLADFIRSIDGMKHREMIEQDASIGDISAIDRIAKVAAGQGKYTDAAAIAHAAQVLADLERDHPEVLRAYLGSKS